MFNHPRDGFLPPFSPPPIILPHFDVHARDVTNERPRDDDDAGEEREHCHQLTSPVTLSIIISGHRRHSYPPMSRSIVLDSLLEPAMSPARRRYFLLIAPSKTIPGINISSAGDEIIMHSQITVIYRVRLLRPRTRALAIAQESEEFASPDEMFQTTPAWLTCKLVGNPRFFRTSQGRSLSVQTESRQESVDRLGRKFL